MWAMRIDDDVTMAALMHQSTVEGLAVLDKRASAASGRAHGNRPMRLLRRVRPSLPSSAHLGLCSVVDQLFQACCTERQNPHTLRCEVRQASLLF